MPSGTTFWTMTGCTSACIVLAAMAFFFGWKERQKDQLEAKEKGHLLSL
jgi:predicted negative regulator of RcsB-dependent stress response